MSGLSGLQLAPAAICLFDAVCCGLTQCTAGCCVGKSYMSSRFSILLQQNGCSLYELGAIFLSTAGAGGDMLCNMFAPRTPPGAPSFSQRTSTDRGQDGIEYARLHIHEMKRPATRPECNTRSALFHVCSMLVFLQRTVPTHARHVTTARGAPRQAALWPVMRPGGFWCSLPSFAVPLRTNWKMGSADTITYFYKVSL